MLLTKLNRGIFAILTILIAFVIVDSDATAAPPYTYDFKPDTREVFNQIGPLNKMEIEFEYDITPYNFTTTPPLISSSPGIIAGAEATHNKITIYFRNLDSRASFLDYSCLFVTNCQYFIEIPSGSLVPKTETTPAFPIESYKIPFSTMDIIPGFKTTFLDSTPTIINQFVFRDNSPREINISIPKIYMTNIETIHRYSGLDPSGNLKPLTNIDISAQAEVSRVRLEYGFGTNNQFSRTLDRKNVSGFNGFTTGQAGLEADHNFNDSQLNPERQAVDEIRLDAYNSFGRFLETRSFKLRVKDKQNEFRINDYIGPIPSHFGQTYTLFSLMENNKLLEEVIKEMPVSQLDHLTVRYTNRISTRKVGTYEELLNAIRDHNVSTIQLTRSIDAPQGVPSLSINRNLTIFGAGHRLGVGNLYIGNGANQIVALRNVRIDHSSIFSDVKINVGSNGTFIGEKLTVDGNVTVESAGSNSVHLHDVDLKNFEIAATSPTRVVVSGNSVIDPSASQGVHVKGPSHHEVNIYSDDIRVTVASNGYIRRLNSYGKNMFLANNSGGTVEQIHGRGVSYMTFLTPTTGVANVTARAEDFRRGKRLMINEITLSNGTKMYFGQTNIRWQIDQHTPGLGTVHWNDQTNYLTITGANANSGIITFEGRNEAGLPTQFIVDLNVSIY